MYLSCNGKFLLKTDASIKQAYNKASAAFMLVQLEVLELLNAGNLLLYESSKLKFVEGVGATRIVVESK